jgi:hypothetical protein
MIAKFHIYRLFTYNASVQAHNNIVEKESREFWRDLVVNKFTHDEATHRRDQYLAKFLVPEVSYKMVNDVEDFENLPDVSDYSGSYVLARHACWGLSNCRYFVFDTFTGKWSPASFSIY